MGKLVNSNDKALSFDFKAEMYEGGILRVLVDEPNGKRPRFQASKYAGLNEHGFAKMRTGFKMTNVNGEYVIESKEEARTSFYQGASQPAQVHTYKIQTTPFKLTSYIDNEETITVNAANLLSIDRQRDEGDSSRRSPAVDSSDFTDRDLFKDEALGRADNQRNGPQSIGLDFKFNSLYLYGIPEHADSYQLKDSIDASGNPIPQTRYKQKDDPYRLFNLDVFEYDLESRFPLYGSIPIMISQDETKTAGMFWSNAAETFIDIQ